MDWKQLLVSITKFVDQELRVRTVMEHGVPLVLQGGECVRPPFFSA